MCIYARKNETHHYDFPMIDISFKYENIYCHELFISNHILLKLKYDVDAYLYIPCVGTKHKRLRVMEFWKRYINANVFMKFGVYENDMLSLCETTNVFFDVCCYSKIDFNQLGSFNLI